MSLACRARASVNLWVDGTVLFPHINMQLNIFINNLLKEYIRITFHCYHYLINKSLHLDRTLLGISLSGDTCLIQGPQMPPTCTVGEE